MTTHVSVTPLPQGVGPVSGVSVFTTGSAGSTGSGRLESGLADDRVAPAEEGTGEEAPALSDEAPAAAAPSVAPDQPGAVDAVFQPGQAEACDASDSQAGFVDAAPAQADLPGVLGSPAAQADIAVVALAMLLSERRPASRPSEPAPRQRRPR
jgi:hypothetical protein